MLKDYYSPDQSHGAKQKLFPSLTFLYNAPGIHCGCGLVTWRERIRETGCQYSEIMAVVGNTGKGRPKKRWNEVVKDNLKKCGLHIDLAKDRERWKTQVMGKASNLCEHGQGT